MNELNEVDPFATLQQSGEIRRSFPQNSGGRFLKRPPGKRIGEPPPELNVTRSVHVQQNVLARNLRYDDAGASWPCLGEPLVRKKNLLGDLRVIDDVTEQRNGDYPTHAAS